ncbi:class I SAM-dependent methyltransferase [Miltoncostaea marina]|uniref:class I SAM-dependent methyltransferase n=1 Tax=Miltoncostaea marina TaxID=2843215 RepID=UPI001C3CC6FC|nr:class I SAM-dependent methyltransferase [Miltoncostaea marina]
MSDRPGFRPPDKPATQGLFAGLAGPAYSRRAALLSLGQEPRWHRFLVDRVPAGPGDRVLDVATGTGAVAERLVLERRCAVTGVDQSLEMLDAARARLADAGLAQRVTLVRAEAERLPFADASFDGLTVTYLLRYVDDPAATLRELARVMRPGAPFASLEFGVPPRALPRALWRLYTGAVLPAAGAVVGGAPWWRAGRFLHRSIPDLYRRHPLPALLELHRAAGLGELRVRRLSFGGAVVIWGRRAG